ncbi:MAG: hypothetical protein ACLR0U_16600 [Enterocloster clostridioformis]
MMDENGSYFENVWHFSAELDDWGEPEYYVNGQKYAQEDWFLAMASGGGRGRGLHKRRLPPFRRGTYKTGGGP